MSQIGSYDDLPEWLRKEIDMKLVDPTGKMRFSDLPERVDLFSMLLADLLIELFHEKEIDCQEDVHTFGKMVDEYLDYVENALETVKSTLTAAYRASVYCSICKKRSFSTTHTTLQVCRQCYLLYRSEVQLVQVHLYRAKAAGVPATLTLGEWVETLKRFNFRCAYCEGQYEVLEHINPISRGGGTTAENCVPACRTCNSTKGTKQPAP